MSSFATYLIGFFIVVIGLAIAAFFLNVAMQWIVVGVIILIGIGIVTATRKEKPRDPPAV